MRNRSRRLACSICSLVCVPVLAQDAPPLERAVQWQAGLETVRMRSGEAMGLASGTLLFDVGSGWSLGPAVHAARSGQRGGLFVGGLAVQRRWLGRGGWRVGAALFAGGGGGADAPVGSGLMLRPSASLTHTLGAQLEAGLTVAQVRFSGGQIHSTQWGLTMAWNDVFRSLTPPLQPQDTRSMGRSGLGVSRLSATIASMALRDGSHRDIGLLGARAEWGDEADGVSWGLESAGAVRGGAAGYMEVLAGAVWRLAPAARALPGLRLGLRATLGLGGGGAVPTGGGGIGRIAALAAWRQPGWSLGLERGATRGTAPAMRARHDQLWLAVDMDRPAGEPARLVRTEWSLALQRYAHAARNSGAEGPLSAVGLKLARQTGDRAYVTGQAHSAYGGGFGAYSVGLVGVGLAQRLSPQWRAGGEVLVGAAGGAGVRTGGGALGQAVAWAGWAAGPSRPEWRLGLGRVRAFRGGLNSPLIEVSWTVPFGQTGT